MSDETKDIIKIVVCLITITVCTFIFFRNISAPSQEESYRLTNITSER